MDTVWSCLLNSIPNALPIYYMQAFRLPQGTINRIITLTRKFLWRGDKSFSGGHCLVSWGIITLSKKDGGLGVMDLRAQNDSLLLRWLWTMYSEPTSLWTDKLRTQLGIHSIQNLTDASCDSLPYFVQDLQTLNPLFHTCTATIEEGNEA
jgi:hypothetical protein